MNEYISIIIPTHNRENSLELCLDSIKKQTYSFFEVIVVDDHSTDNTEKFMLNYSKFDNRFRYIKQDASKTGAQAARNLGIKNSSYNWIMFNDSDDTWEQDKIAKELEVLEKHNFNSDIVIYSDCNIININTKEKKYWALPHISENNSYSDLLSTSGPMFQSLLCSKKHIEEISYLDENVPSYQEWDTSIRLAENGFFIHIEEPLFDYYVGANDAISKSVSKDFIGRCNIYNKFKSEIIKYNGINFYKEIIKKQIEVFLDFEDKSIFENNTIFSNFLSNCFYLFKNDLSKSFGKIIQKDDSFKKNILYKIIRKVFRKFFSICKQKEKEIPYSEKAKSKEKLYSSPVLWGQNGNDYLLKLLKSNRPIFISRFGSIELSTLINYGKEIYPKELRNLMRTNTGFFPVTNRNLDNFCKTYFESIKQIDIIGVCFNDGEAKIMTEYAPEAHFVELGCLNSFLFNNPYTQFLKGKKVLVIHPFVNTINQQYNIREKLFQDSDVLPEFKIHIITPPQTIADNTNGYISWFEGLEDTYRKIDKVDFDIALIGAGAYGLPIGAYIKSKGKTAIHIGGALQLLFGIKGSRWVNNNDHVTRLFNENWTYPLETDTPHNSDILKKTVIGNEK